MFVAGIQWERLLQAKWLLVASACLLLQGCPPSTYDILAERRDGRILLLVHKSGSSDDDDIFANRMIVRDAGRIVWLIQGSGRADCPLEGTTPPFPVFYGQVPNCYRELVPAQPLAVNVLYRVQAHGGLRAGDGYFRLDPTVRNLEWDEVDAELRRWPELQEPS